jgi:hypothetical protein
MTIFEGRMFGRRMKLQVGTIDFASEDEFDPQLGDDGALRVSFAVRKEIPRKVAATAGAEPPALELAIYNLAERTRRKLDGLKGTSLRGIAMSAGYGEDIGVIFAGELHTVTSAIEGTEWVTKIVGKTGKTAGSVVVNESLPPGASKGDRALKLLEVLQRENPGTNFDKAKARIKAGDAKGVLDTIVNGVTMAGKALEQFRVLSKDLGLEAWIDDGEALALAPGEVRGDRRVVLRADTGLIGPPTRIEDPKSPDMLIVRMTSLLQWRLALAGAVELESGGLNGFFRVRALRHTGDTHEGDWQTEIEADELVSAYDPLTKQYLQPELDSAVGAIS